MNPGYKKYIPFQPQKIVGRTWPDKVITKAPIWCSVDLRDGNQALVDPMNLEEKLEYFHTLVDIGIKEIAEAAGYENIINFYKYFKQTTGCTPAAFREKRGKSGGEK